MCGIVRDGEGDMFGRGVDVMWCGCGVDVFCVKEIVRPRALKIYIESIFETAVVYSKRRCTSLSTIPKISYQF